MEGSEVSDLSGDRHVECQVNHHMSGQLESLKPGDSLVDDMQARLTVVVHLGLNLDNLQHHATFNPWACVLWRAMVRR